MSLPLRLATIATMTSLMFAQPSLQQTYSTCNPVAQSGCPADTALGTSINADFRNGASSQFTASGNPTYNSNGAALTVSGAGDAPTLESNWYIMFGKVSVTMKAAPGTGIVSSSVLQSDDLDEIDWEWLGGQGTQVQSNYFGKGQTTTYDRAAVHAVDNTEGQYHTYTIEWTDEPDRMADRWHDGTSAERKRREWPVSADTVQAQDRHMGGRRSCEPSGHRRVGRRHYRLLHRPLHNVRAIRRRRRLLDWHKVYVRRSKWRMDIDRIDRRQSQRQCRRFANRHCGTSHHVHIVG